jgi:hypothetical protein
MDAANNPSWPRRSCRQGGVSGEWGKRWCLAGCCWWSRWWWQLWLLALVLPSSFVALEANSFIEIIDKMNARNLRLVGIYKSLEFMEFS